MDLLLGSIALASLPVFSFIFQYYFSSKNNQIKDFKANFTVYYVDWFFVPFNLLFLYSVMVDFKIIIFSFVLGVIALTYYHNYWRKSCLKGNKTHFYKGKSCSISGAGVTHYAFSVVQFALVASFILSEVNENMFIAPSSVLVIFFLGVLYGSKKIHGKVDKGDLVAAASGMIAVLAKIAFV